ncbi:uncharacterized protein LOC143485162 [Brachyhypopomus gauderio]|uniref:uncharacterized protein LOC143485162 n=1 Tax=Brachyhypopomus gauderio TaxID=698409 RepID=UPI0040436242
MSKLKTELTDVESSPDREAQTLLDEAADSSMDPEDVAVFPMPPRPVGRPLLLSPKLLNGEAEYACNVCGETFFSLAQLAKHVQFHDHDRPFPCAICGKRFLSRSHHTEHQRVHTGERPFPCNRCERSFTTHHNLKRHQLIHDKEEMYRCTVCGVLFCQEHQLGNIGGIIRVLKQHDMEPLIDPQTLLQLDMLPEAKPAVEDMSQLKPKKRRGRKRKKRGQPKREDFLLDDDLYPEEKEQRGHLEVPRVLRRREVDVSEAVRRPAGKIRKIAYDMEVVL